ncbi:Ger(x)C family spore germination protein [Cohnella caldifontis]|uniref:Ger(x)C family spore germination protein n=1 Tax=Cohnella caldifontis TaxID=3027471 RepID=UPI0023ED33F6|nr:Ger(x)C family spore germination protein [Cohnella sp. YIM B05605]
MRRVLRCAVGFLLILPLAGCWNRIELNELGIMTATGFDWENGEWIVTFQEVVPSTMTSGMGGASGGKGSQATVHVFTTRGKTIREADSINNLEHSRWVYLAHNNVLILGRGAAKHGIQDVLDKYFRDTDARLTTELLVTDGDARTILKQFVPPETLPGAAIAAIIRKEDRFSSIFPSVNVFQAALKLSSEARAVGIPEIALSGAEDSGLESMDVYKVTAPPAKLKLSRLAVFRKDRLIGWMNREESLGVSWLSDRIKSSTFSVPCPDAGSASESRNMAYRVDHAEVKVIPRKANGGFRMIVKADATGELLQYGCKEDLTKPGTVRIMEKQVRQKIMDDMESGWTAMRSLHADLAGFADRIHRKYPKTWKRIKPSWNEELPQTDLDLRVSAKIRRQGLIYNPVR